MSKFGLESAGLRLLRNVHWSLNAPRLYEEALKRGEGVVVQHGALAVHTGKFTARAAEDKYFVKESSTADHIWWGQQNRPISIEKFDGLHARLSAYLQGRDVFVQDCIAGAGDVQFKVRVITECAWQSLFARNMLAPCSSEEAETFIPDFTVIAAPHFFADPRIDGTRSETAIAINFASRLALICGTSYAGEIKKTVFTVMNYLLPFQGILPMHCSANRGPEGDVAIFFGLSGTGKTTLSADPKRDIIGDDEHGWSSDSTFNFENGCYAKVIRLSPQNEPDIYRATKRFGTILENVVYDPETRAVNFDDASLTENTRASYPIEFIDHSVKERFAQATPKNVILLTCDAQGVLPPIARLNPEQSLYHFISGYTSKIAGTELGLGKEPQMTFSACFGAPFMVHPPYRYAQMLKERLERDRAQCWLINTGWVGGPYGVGHRISIGYTRALLDAALTGQLADVAYSKDPVFGFEIPQSCPNVPGEILNPAQSWPDSAAYRRAADALASKYIENFKLYAAQCPIDLSAIAPKRLAQ